MEATGAELTPSQQRGRELYNNGAPPGRPPMPAGITQQAAPGIPCLNCHAVDGAGGMGDPAAPNVQWQHLSGADEHQHPLRRHPPFDAAAFARAVTKGIDPGGNALDVAMPRYTLSPAQLADLLAYLTVIAVQRDPGLSGNLIRIGTVLPASGPLAGAGLAMRRVIEACFTTVNARGGIHGRRLLLEVGHYDPDRGPPVWAARDLLASDSIFALVSGYVPGDEPALQALVNEKRVPLVGPNTVLPAGGESNRYAFYLLSGLAEQAEALVVSFAARDASADRRLAIVYPRAQFIDEVAERARLRAVALGLPPPDMTSYELGGFDAQAVAGRLRGEPAGAVLFAGSAREFARLADAAAALGWQPELLAPGSLAQAALGELPGAFAGRVWLALATIPADRNPDAWRQLEQLRDEFALGSRHGTAQIAAFNAAGVLVEGLRRAGPDPSREKLVAALEQLEAFRPGLSPPLTFGPDRRIGARGAYVLPVDLERRRLEPARGGWVTLGE